MRKRKRIVPARRRHQFPHGKNCSNGVFCWCQRKERLARRTMKPLNVSSHQPKLLMRRKIGRK